jgi:hypothetical protein
LSINFYSLGCCGLNLCFDSSVLTSLNVWQADRA